MKKWIITGLMAQLASAAVAQERAFVCISEVDGEEYRLTHSGIGTKGTVSFKDKTGEAQVFPGLNNLTFILANDQNVMSFFVEQPDLTYSLSVRRPTLRNDRGQCTETES
ncbi:hypothetical protein SL1157_2870 [Ruegeria lacuscaerulensis ITI-1157]|nr:hypothetical protein SL1157_2870 [Ruegeria lacuscaerulensis ITI-1157]SHK18561.1 hypothetical protein SAMN05444404_3435 [Ruegeria lacuscaerulensis ITI-1157]